MRVDEKTLHHLGWHELLEALALRTYSVRGAERARALAFAETLAKARERSLEVSEARQLFDHAGAVPLGGICELRATLERARKGGILEATDLREIASTLAAGTSVRRFILGNHEIAPKLAARAESLVELREIEALITDSFDSSGKLVDHASDALGPLRKRVQELHQALTRAVHQLLEDPEVSPLLQDRFYTLRDERYVLPIKVAAKAQVRGIVHGSSQSGQTVFVEPEAVVDLNNALKIAELDVLEEERRILSELSTLVRDSSIEINANGDILEHLDLVFAAAKLAGDLSAEPVRLAEDAAIALDSARHPLMVLAGHPCVPVDIAFPRGGALIVSGPNAGGKTVALKTLGLSVLMARAGLHLPADASSSLPFFDAIACDMGDDQSIERNLSTFSAHVLHLSDFVRRAQPGTLILLDELCVGTDPEQGAALGQSVLETLVAAGATTMVTTHFDRLKALAARDGRFQNASVGFDLEKLEPTYKLQLGVPGASGAFALARRLGMGEETVRRAEALIGSQSVDLERLLREVADEKCKVERERAELDSAKRETERERQRLADESRDLRDRVKTLHKQSYDEAVEALREARVALEGIKSGKRRPAQPARALDEMASTIAKHAPAREAESGATLREEEIVPGIQVHVVPWGKEGTVLAAPDKGTVQILAGSLKATVKVTDLRRGTGKVGAGRSSRQSQRYAGVASSSADEAHSGDTLDLRGERVDDAVSILDKFLDQSLERGIDVAYVLHGHGTGALRQAVREHLARHPAVARFHAAEPEKGGDAVTAVELG